MTTRNAAAVLGPAQSAAASSGGATDESSPLPESTTGGAPESTTGGGPESTTGGAWQMPLTHGCPLHEVPHAPQLVASVMRSTSQPLLATPSQLA